jgi:hypothetical protein
MGSGQQPKPGKMAFGHQAVGHVVLAEGEVHMAGWPIHPPRRMGGVTMMDRE